MLMFNIFNKTLNKMYFYNWVFRRNIKSNYLFNMYLCNWKS